MARMTGLRHGPWQEVLVDVECDAVITDSPYSERVHRAGALIEGKDDAERSVEIGYEAFTEAHIKEFCESWSPRTTGWMCMHTSHDLVPAWESYLNEVGRYVFPPLPCVMRGMSVRLQGDGPSSWCCWLMVARPKRKEFMSWGTLPGAYITPPPSRASAKGAKSIPMGQKPLTLISAIVRDYSRKGMLVVDPFSGGGTTAIACESMGRKFVGAEKNAKTYAKAQERLSSSVQFDLFKERPPKVQECSVQADLFGGG